jgi:hypothetical protein
MLLSFTFHLVKSTIIFLSLLFHSGTLSLSQILSTLLLCPGIFSFFIKPVTGICFVGREVKSEWSFILARKISFQLVSKLVEWSPGGPQCCQVPKTFPASTSKKFGQFRKKFGQFPKTSISQCLVQLQCLLKIKFNFVLVYIIRGYHSLK